MNPILIAAIIVFAAALLILLGAYEYRQHAKSVDASLQGFKEHANRVQASIAADTARINAAASTVHSVVTKASADIKAAVTPQQ